MPRDLKYRRKRKLHVLMISSTTSKRVGDGKGRAVGNEIYVYSHLGSAGEDL